MKYFDACETLIVKVPEHELCEPDAESGYRKTGDVLVAMQSHREEAEQQSRKSAEQNCRKYGDYHRQKAVHHAQI